MQNTTTDLSMPLTEVRPGHRYTLAVTGATTAVSLEFQHVKEGAWFPQPGFTATPAGGVVFSEFVCITPRMRVNCAAGQVAAWTATWSKQVISDI
jgi:hypothetical protein